MVSVAWREISTRAVEVATMLSRDDTHAHGDNVSARHSCKIAVAVRRVAMAPREETSAMRRWIAAFNDATAARRALTIRSLASLAVNRAVKIEAVAKAARLADYRLALSATSVRPAATPSAPSRLAFRYVRGISGWARSPIGDESRGGAIALGQSPLRCNRVGEG